MSDEFLLDIFASWYTFLAIILLAIAIMSLPTIIQVSKKLQERSKSQ